MARGIGILGSDIATLWVFSAGPCFFLAPDAQLLIDETGQALPAALQYLAPILTVDDFRGHLEHAKIIVLVAEDKPFAADFLAAIPPRLPTLVVIGDATPAAVRQPLSALNAAGYLFGAVQAAKFSAAIDKALDKPSSDKLDLSAIELELKKYTDIAFTAMSSASEMGVVAQFAERAQTVMSIERLAQLSLNCLRDLNVDGVLQFAFDDDAAVYPSTAPDSYKKLLNGARTANSRIISHGRFLIFSFNHVQMLISDAPHEDLERYGRLRDILAPIVSIAEARLKTLKVNDLLKSQQANSKRVMLLLEMSSTDNRRAVKTIMTELSLSLREMATGLELTLAQENAMLKLSDDALESLESLHEATGQIDKHFRSLLTQLDSAALLLQTAPTEQTDSVDSGDSGDSKVELF